MQETMLQEVMAAPREIRFDRVPVPTAGPGQVLVKIKRIGICGSDIHVSSFKEIYISCWSRFKSKICTFTCSSEWKSKLCWIYEWIWKNNNNKTF